jgi:hypothetical protein
LMQFMHNTCNSARLSRKVLIPVRMQSTKRD